jgi:KDO2-lipid IV(A) lauroyltransferase
MTKAANVKRRRIKRSLLRSFLEYAAFSLLESIFRIFPPVFVDRMGCFLGICAYHLLPGRRATVRRNCRIAWGERLSRDELEILTRKTFRDNGANLLGGMRCMIMSDATLQKHFTIEGDDLIRDTLNSSETGAIFALCHMGNWEILARIATLISPTTPAGAFFRPLNNPWMNRMTMRRRQQSGTKLFSNKEGFMQSFPLLRSGGMLGILADQHAGGTGCFSTFFGRPTSCSPLVELLQRRTGAAVFFVAVMRTSAAHWHISITKYESQEPLTTRICMQGIERALSLSPSDGFWLHNRWKLMAKRPFHQVHARETLEPSQITKPWRYVIVGSQDPAIAKATVPAIKHLAAQYPYSHFDLFHLPAIPISNQINHYSVSDLKELRGALQALDACKSYPIDVLVYCCPLAMVENAHLGLDISIVAGLTAEKLSHIGLRVAPPSTLMEDPQTWWYFFTSLGLKVPTIGA